MDTIFTIDDPEDFRDKLNLDELYEKKQQSDLNTLNTYNTILNRIHSRIKITSRQNIQEQFCFYIIPEVMIGIPKYDHGACTAYIINKLRDNGFIVKYTHPNLLFISWKHWVPDYVRAEIKKKTGVAVDGFGNKIIKEDSKIKTLTANLDKKEKADNYKKIESYKPSGKLIYNEHLLNKSFQK